MKLFIPSELMGRIHLHIESAYPEEGAGLLLGLDQGERRIVQDLLPLDNSREETARHNRYLITPQDLLRGEQEAERQGLVILGVFHSHPDHPSQPSEFDREYAIPWYSYLITSVRGGKAADSRCWRLFDDRSGFQQEGITILPAGEPLPGPESGSQAG